VAARISPGRIKSELDKGVKLSKCRHCGCMKGTLEEMRGLLSARRDKESTELRRDVSSWLNRLEDTLYT
jgi:tetrahydromethanopterin S-methyltransferase subunit A